MTLNINNPRDWATAFLDALGCSSIGNNEEAVIAWEAQEGGHWKNNAHYNPLNTTYNYPPCTSINSVGVKAYTTWEQGIEANIFTIRLPFYANVVDCLKGNVNPDLTLHAISASPWGTHFNAPASAYQSYAGTGSRSTPQKQPRSYTVKPGDTLWGIAKHFYGYGAAYPRIATANKVTNPNLIYPGQVLIIP